MLEVVNETTLAGCSRVLASGDGPVAALNFASAKNPGGGFLNGPARQWVDELLPLVVKDGISTFILMADDSRTMERFAGEVIPALREAAARRLGPPVRLVAIATEDGELQRVAEALAARV